MQENENCSTDSNEQLHTSLDLDELIDTVKNE